VCGKEYDIKKVTESMKRTSGKDVDWSEYLREMCR
jgi:hypothetical protein